MQYNTFDEWNAKNYRVKKGSKALLYSKDNKPLFSENQVVSKAPAKKKGYARSVAKVEIPRSGHDMKRGETYGDYLIRLTAQMQEQAQKVKEEGVQVQLTGSSDNYREGHSGLKDLVEKLVSIIYEADNIMN